MELLVVLLIIGILSTVALRTIDATRDRGLFDETTNEMNKLVQAMVGNPDLTYDGRRVDFGFYGDMERLPDSLPELVKNTTGSAYWHGPYFKLMRAGDTASYQYDGWGTKYSYPNGDFTIVSFGSVKYPMTVKVADDMVQLGHNSIAGTITDIDDAPPGSNAAVTPLIVRLSFNNPDVHGGAKDTTAIPYMDGHYEFSDSSRTVGGRIGVPIGIHKLVAKWGTKDSLIRWVTVVPRSQTIVDFKFPISFWKKLRLTLPITYYPDSLGFSFKVLNSQSDTAVISYLTFLSSSDPLYMRDFRIGGDHITKGTGENGWGPGDTIRFTSTVTIPPNGLVELAFADFHVLPAGTDEAVKVTGHTFKFVFSDNSEIDVQP
jgi:type II secretory pathway pseudopilin PulG